MIQAELEPTAPPALATTRRLRVLLVAPKAPPVGGMTRYASDILDSELARRHHITLFADNIPAHMRPRQHTIAVSRNLIGAVRRDGLRTTCRVLAFVATRTLDLHRTLHGERYDIVHLLSCGGLGLFRNIIHVYMARRAGARTVLHILGDIDGFYRRAGRCTRRLLSRGLDAADVHVVQSPGLAAFVQGITHRPVYSILNGVRTETLAPPDGYAHGSGDSVTVVSVGSLGQRKGTFDLMDAAEQLLDSRPPFRFVLVGSGQVDYFRELARQRGLTNVQFTGPVDDDVRTQTLWAADIFTLPSYSEGQPIAILEAMAAGLPVVASDVGSVAEVIRSANGFVVAPGDVAALVRCFRTLAADPGLREQMGRHNAREAFRTYHLDRVMAEIDQVYAAVAG